MIAVDTNILIYAHREESPWHGKARACLEQLDASSRPWGLPWPVVHEFLAISTHPRIFDPPTPLSNALSAVDGWLAAQGARLLTESDAHWPILRELLREAQIKGPRIHDARIVALCLAHGVSELWTADRDFSRFPALHARNPLGEGGR